MQVRRSRGVLTITLDRPAVKNAIDRLMFTELLRSLDEAGGDPARDRVVVVTGAGDAFCSGADLSEFEHDRPDLAYMRMVANVCLALHRLPQPTIAKVNGVAVGAGMNLALACDLVVAADSARFSEIFARRGLGVDFGGSWVLPRLIGMHRAKELVLLADIIDAATAAELGLVNRVVPAGELDKSVNDWARRLADGAPLALSSSKRLLNQAYSVSLDEALEAEAHVQSGLFRTADADEALAAFAEKRDPVFRGS